MHCGVPKIKLSSGSLFTLRELYVSILESGVKCIHWKTPSMEMFDPYITLNTRKCLEKDFPSASNLSTLGRTATAKKSRVHNMVAIASYQCHRACKRRVLAPKVRILMWDSEIPFWWYVPTAKNVISWLASSTASQNICSAYCPLPTWYLLTLTP